MNTICIDEVRLAAMKMCSSGAAPCNGLPLCALFRCLYELPVLGSFFVMPGDTKSCDGDTQVLTGSAWTMNVVRMQGVQQGLGKGID
jgi:hypothetical protein